MTEIQFEVFTGEEHLQLRQQLLKLIDSVVSGELHDYQAQEAFIKYSESLGYHRSDGGMALINDLARFPRVKLIFDSNVALRHGLGRFLQSQDRDVFDCWPAQELIVVGDENSEVSFWRARWQAVGGRVTQGRMIASKLDGIWQRLSIYNLPFPPFDFSAYGEDVEDVSADEAEALGISKVDHVSFQTLPAILPLYWFDEVPPNPSAGTFESMNRYFSEEIQIAEGG